MVSRDDMTNLRTAIWLLAAMITGTALANMFGAPPSLGFVLSSMGWLFVGIAVPAPWDK